MSDTGFPRGDGIPATGGGGGAPTGPAGGDLAGTYPNPTIGLLAITAANIANATITDVQVAAANKDGLAAVASMRTLGAGAQQAMAGNDARVVGALQAANNLSDLTNAATARSNLGAATDALVVHLAGAETVTGVKTFSAGIILAATIAMGGFAITGMANPALPQDAATKAYVDSLVPASYTAGTGLTLTGSQFAIDATVATLTGTQTLTNKTLTTPTINGAALSGTLSGTPTFSGNITFGASIIGGTLGPTSGQQHTVPAVTSDTFALIAATQTLTNKTLTSPKMNFGSDARGDLIVRGITDYGRLALGTAGQAIVSNGTDPGYDFITIVGKNATDSTYDGGVKLGTNAEETVSSNVTLSATTTWHNVNTSASALTPVLPSAAATGSLHVVNDSTGSFATNNCTIDPQGTDTINGSSANVVLTTAWGTYTFKKLTATSWQLCGGSA